MPGMDIVALSSALGRDIDSAEIISLVDTLAAAATGSSPTTRLKAEVSSFPDVTFHNYHPLGVSFSYIPSTVPGQASSSKLVLDRIDIYIADPSSSAAAPPARPGRQPKPTFSRFPLDLSLSFPTTSIALPSPPPAQPCTTSSRDTSPTASTTREREKIFVVRAQTRGRDFVAALGEPSRKGGGSGGVGGFAGVPPWMEWNNVELEVGEPQGNDESRHTARIGLMVELRDPGGAEVLTEEQRKKGAGGVWDRAANWRWSCLKVFPAGQTQ